MLSARAFAVPAVLPLAVAADPDGDDVSTGWRAALLQAAAATRAAAVANMRGNGVIRMNLPESQHGRVPLVREIYGQVMQSYLDNHPPDEFTSVRDGGNYGWPFCNPNPDTPSGMNNRIEYHEHLAHLFSDDMRHLADVQAD